MLELLTYLRANGFQTWIVSGGGIDFMRVFAEAVYGIPPAQVIGSSGKVQFEFRDGRPVLIKLPELSSFDDKEGKPANIHLHIGRRPILAGGNSDGDLAMLQYTAGGDGRSLALIVDHDDAEREYAYRVSPLGRLEVALAEARQRGWTIVSMQGRLEPGLSPLRRARHVAKHLIVLSLIADSSAAHRSRSLLTASLIEGLWSEYSERRISTAAIPLRGIAL